MKSENPVAWQGHLILLGLEASCLFLCRKALGGFSPSVPVGRGLGGLTDTLCRLITTVPRSTHFRVPITRKGLQSWSPDPKELLSRLFWTQRRSFSSEPSGRICFWLAFGTNLDTVQSSVNRSSCGAPLALGWFLRMLVSVASTRLRRIWLQLSHLAVFCLSCRNKEGPDPGRCAQDCHDRGQGEVTASMLLLGVGREHTDHHAFLQCPCIWAGCCRWLGADLHTKPGGPGPSCASGPGRSGVSSAWPQEGSWMGPLPAQGSRVPRASLQWGSTVPRCDCQRSTCPLHLCAEWTPVTDCFISEMCLLSAWPHALYLPWHVL